MRGREGRGRRERGEGGKKRGHKEGVKKGE